MTTTATATTNPVADALCNNFRRKIMSIQGVAGWAMGDFSRSEYEVSVVFTNVAYPNGQILFAMRLDTRSPQLYVTPGLKSGTGIDNYRAFEGFAFTTHSHPHNNTVEFFRKDMLTDALPLFVEQYNKISSLEATSYQQHKDALAHAETLIALSGGALRRKKNRNGVYEKQWEYLIALEPVSRDYDAMLCTLQVGPNGSVTIRDVRTSMSADFAKDFAALFLRYA